MSETKNQVKRIPNPTGKGGFKERPQDINPGTWNSKNVFTIQLSRFLNMSTTDFEAFAKTPKDKMTMAERIAYTRVAKGKDLAEYKDMADRLQGKAAQSVDVTSDGDKLEGLVIIKSFDE